MIHRVSLLSEECSIGPVWPFFVLQRAARFRSTSAGADVRLRSSRLCAALEPGGDKWQCPTSWNRQARGLTILKTTATHSTRGPRQKQFRPAINSRQHKPATPTINTDVRPLKLRSPSVAGSRVEFPSSSGTSHFQRKTDTRFRVLTEISPFPGPDDDSMAGAGLNRLLVHTGRHRVTA